VDTNSRPDVVLVAPRDFDAVPHGAPVQDSLAIGFLAARLRAEGRHVVVLDAHALDLSDEAIVACVAELRPRVVGLTLHSFAHYDHCVTISRGIAALEDPPPCVWGGEHATFHAETILRQHPEVYAVVLSEGEDTLVDLVDRLVGPGHTRRLPLLDDAAEGPAVVGAVLRDDAGQIVHGGYRLAIEDLDAIPRAHKDIVELALAAGKEVSISMLTGRGCTHRCRFCTAHEFMRLGGGVVWRRRSATDVVAEMLDLHRRYFGDPLVHPVIQFQDVIFLGTSRAARRWTEEFLDELDRVGLRIPFYCMSRADAIIANEPLLPRLVQAGLWSVEMGIETGIDRILQSYNKLNSAASNAEAVDVLRRSGVTFDASGFIMFDPQMTLSEVRENAAYLRDFGAATWDFFVTRLQLYPGTELRAEMIQKGLFDGADDIGRTAGYAFEDPRVGLVADHVFYYDSGIRILDLLLRDAKAIQANQIRAGHEPYGVLDDAIRLVHATYHDHVIAIADAVEADRLESDFAGLVQTFLSRIQRLRALLDGLVRQFDRAGRVPQPEPALIEV
jgi:radical SAM superfamily enzyme YgiQ (UPF0313 family)